MRKLIGLAVCAMGLTLMGQTTPAVTAPSEIANVTVSDMRVETLQGYPFLHFTQTTTINGMIQHLGADVEKMMAAMRANNIIAHGQLVLVMHGINGDYNHPFELEAGFKVDSGTKAPANYQVSNLPASKSAVALYSGPLDQVKMAYQKLYPGLFGAGLTPTGNVREYLLYYESGDSPNNVAMAAVEVQ